MKELRADWQGRKGWVALCATMLLVAGVSAWAGYPDSADIESVTGRWTGTRAEVVWTTLSEAGTAGFRVFRVETHGETLLNTEPIPIDLSRPGGSTYSVVDPARSRNSTGTYRVEELRGDGRRLSLGVWTVKFVRPAPVKAAATVAPTSSSFAPMSGSTPGPAAKVWVESNDIYSVSFAAIASALGWSEAAVADGAAQAQLAMRCGSEPVSYRVEADAGRILFYGWGVTNRYTRQNAFWIEPGTGLHMQRVAPEDIPGPADLTFTGTAFHEKNLGIMLEHSGILRDDLYFWTHIVSGNATVGERTFPVPLEGYRGGEVKVLVRVTGWNDTPANPDHRVEVYFNGTLLGAFTLDGKADAQAEFTASEAGVLPTGNQVRIRGVLQSGVSSSILVIQGFSLTYRQDYGVRGGPLEATDGGHGRLAAVGYSDARVLEVTDPRTPIVVADAMGNLAPEKTWPAQTGSRWIYRERSAIPALVPVPAGSGSWLKSAANAVDYLVIAPRVFEAPARVLADYRSSMGLRSAVAIYEDICDQFAAGLNTPEAIRTCLTYAQQHWAVAPWMVVLGGWGHYDYFGVFTTATNFLPALLGSDSATLRPADGLLADIQGDDEVPDLAMGRLPVQSVGQFNAYLAKLQAYETAGPQAWHGRAVFAADNVDSDNFTATSQQLAAEAAARYATELTSLDMSSLAEVRTAIRAAFTNGSAIVHYTGHGSYRQLATENLFHYTDVTSLANPPVPLFAAMTCYIGRFDLHDQRCLAEALVLQPAGGALAVYSASGFSYDFAAAPFGRELHRLHAVEHADTIGPALLRTRRSFGALSGLQADAVRTYNLLGDPALKLKGGGGGTPPSWIPTYAQWRWERSSYAELTATGGSPNEDFGAYVTGGTMTGLTPIGVEKGTGRAVARWVQRKFATDADYRLMVSTNLMGSWSPAPPETATGKNDLPDGVMEEWEAKFPFPLNPLFIRLEVIRK